MNPREVFLQQILALDPEQAVLFMTHPGHDHPEAHTFHGLTKMVWKEDYLREVMGMPSEDQKRDARILFDIDLPAPMSSLVGQGQRIRYIITAESLARAAAREVEGGLRDGLAQRCLALQSELDMLEQVKKSQTPTIQAILEEVERARAKYPEKDLQARFTGFAQEVGEALQALAKAITKPQHERRAELAHARLEVIQAAGQAIRLLEEAL